MRKVLGSNPTGDIAFFGDTLWSTVRYSMLFNMLVYFIQNSVALLYRIYMVLKEGKMVFKKVISFGNVIPGVIKHNIIFNIFCIQ